VRRSAVQEKKDDPLGAGSEMRPSLGARGGQRFRSEQPGQSDDGDGPVIDV